MNYLFDMIVILFIFIKVILPRIKRDKNKKGAILFVFFIYLSLVYSLTLMPFRPLTNIMTSGLQIDYNLYAFDDIINSYGPAEKEALLNVLMMIPFGVFLPLIKGKDMTLLKVGIYTFLLSLSIETLQLLDPRRSSDVTDLITNTIGGIIGFIIFNYFSKKHNKSRKEKKT